MLEAGRSFAASVLALGADDDETARAQMQDNRFFKPTATDYASERILSTAGDVGRFAGGVAYGFGNYAPTLLATTALTAVSGPAGLAAGMGMSFMQGMGKGYKDALLEGKTVNEARMYGLTLGAFRAGSYALFNAVGTAGGALARGLDKAAAAGIGQLGRAGLGATGQAALRSGSNILTRGIAEGTGGAMQYNADLLARNIAFGENNKLDFASDEVRKQFMLSFAIGAVAEVPYAFGSFKGYKAGYSNLDMYQRAAGGLWENNDLIGNTGYTNQPNSGNININNYSPKRTVKSMLPKGKTLKDISQQELLEIAQKTINNDLAFASEKFDIPKSKLNRMDFADMDYLWGELNNLETRTWYHEHISRISKDVNLTQPLEYQARQASAFRNEYRTQARYLMADENAKMFLDDSRPNRPFEYYVKKYSKPRADGSILTLEDIYKLIIQKAQTSNKDFDAIVGLK